MKKLMFVVAFCATTVAFCDNGTGGSKDSLMQAKDAQKTLAENPVKENSEEAKAEARLEAQGEARAASEDRAAAKQGVSPEELRLQRRAKDLGITAEEYKKLSPEERRAQGQAKRDERMAKKLGMTVEEFKKLTPEDRRAKLRDARRKYVAERDAKNAAKAGEEKPAEAPKAEASK